MPFTILEENILRIHSLSSRSPKNKIQFKRETFRQLEFRVLSKIKKIIFTKITLLDVTTHQFVILIDFASAENFSLAQRALVSNSDESKIDLNSNSGK